MPFKFQTFEDKIQIFKTAEWWEVVAMVPCDYSGRVQSKRVSDDFYRYIVKKCKLNSTTKDDEYRCGTHFLISLSAGSSTDVVIPIIVVLHNRSCRFFGILPGLSQRRLTMIVNASSGCLVLLMYKKCCKMYVYSFY